MRTYRTEPCPWCRSTDTTEDTHFCQCHDCSRQWPPPRERGRCVLAVTNIYQEG